MSCDSIISVYGRSRHPSSIKTAPRDRDLMPVGVENEAGCVRSG